MELGRKERLDGIDPLLFLNLREEGGEGAHEDHVCSLGVAELACDLLSVNDHDVVFEVLLEGLLHVLRIRACSEAHGGGKDLLLVDHDLAFGLYPVDVAQGFEELEGEEEVDVAVLDEGRIDLLAEPEMGRHVAASLGHTVDFGFLHIISGLEKDFGEDVAGEDRALAAYAGEKDICYFIRYLS